MHRLLKYAKRRELARELQARGFKVSGESLNRWVRTEAEMPSDVVQEIRRIYGIDEEALPPAWAEGLETRLLDEIRTNREVVVALLEARAAEDVERAVEALDEPPHGAQSPGTGGALPVPAARKQGR